jgi:4a-hydroxytetrahydrobiopterin dehydratase
MKHEYLRTKAVTKETVPLSTEEVEKNLACVPKWSLANRTIGREFRFKDFRQAMGFVNRVAGIATIQDHHPDLFISYNKVQVTLSTHKAGGLTSNDFIVAAKIDLLVKQQDSERAA